MSLIERHYATDILQKTPFPPVSHLPGGLAVLPFHPQFAGCGEVLAERGIDVSYETVRCWAKTFGRVIAANIRRSRPRPGNVWHIDEMVVRINGKRMFMWRAVDDEGEVLDVLV